MPAVGMLTPKVAVPAGEVAEPVEVPAGVSMYALPKLPAAPPTARIGATSVPASASKRR